MVACALNVRVMASTEDEQLAAFGYRQELSRVLSLFDNFSVAFSYLSPMVGIYSLYTLGLGTGGPRYVWTIPIVVGLMTLVALVFGELASEYPLSGALYQYGKFTVGPRYGWFIGWIYGFALLATVASVDSGAVTYVAALANRWFGTHWDPSSHVAIFAIAGGIVVLSALLNWVGATILGRVARFGVYVETIGTFGVFLALAIFGFHQHLGFIFSTQSVEHVASNPLGLNFGGNWWTGSALVAVLANVYIFYGFESAGDISEETIGARRQVPKAMRNALLYGGIASFVLVLGLLLATPATGINGVVSGGIDVILGTLPRWLQDFFLVMVIVAFFSCGTAVQGAGARVAFALARDGALPFSESVERISRTSPHARERDPGGDHRPVSLSAARSDQSVKAGANLVVRVPRTRQRALRARFVRDVGHLLGVLADGRRRADPRARGWRPGGPFTLGRWGPAVTVGAALYLALMLLDIVWPSSLSSGRAVFNYGWITLLVMAVIVGIGAAYEVTARPDRRIRGGLR